MPKTLKQLTGLLPNGKFIRVHRNSLVNCQYIERLERQKSGLGTIYLVNGSALPVSRRRLEAIFKQLSNQ